eukprot:SAG22_NODE_4973_length_1119_cov_1.193137_1_plen_344_part_10
MGGVQPKMADIRDKPPGPDKKIGQKKQAHRLTDEEGHIEAAKALLDKTNTAKTKTDKPKATLSTPPTLQAPSTSPSTTKELRPQTRQEIQTQHKTFNPSTPTGSIELVKHLQKTAHPETKVHYITDINQLETALQQQLLISKDAETSTLSTETTLQDHIVLILDCEKLSLEDLARLNSNERLMAQLANENLNKDGHIKDPDVGAKKLSLVPINYAQSNTSTQGNVSDVHRRLSALLQSPIVKDIAQKLQEARYPEPEAQSMPASEATQTEAKILAPIDYEGPKSTACFLPALYLNTKGLQFTESLRQETLLNLPKGNYTLTLNNFPSDTHETLLQQVAELNQFQ